MAQAIQPIVLVHGGAGDIPDTRVLAKLNGVCEAARKGYNVLKGSGSVLDGIITAVEIMEDDPVFNAGRAYMILTIYFELSHMFSYRLI